MTKATQVAKPAKINWVIDAALMSPHCSSNLNQFVKGGQTRLCGSANRRHFSGEQKGRISLSRLSYKSLHRPYKLLLRSDPRRSLIAFRSSLGDNSVQQETVILGKASKPVGRNEIETGEIVRFQGPAAVKSGNEISNHRKHLQSANERELLAELFELLEDYSPSWYTEAHHDRIVAALSACSKRN
jgi:hypothetical protein